MGTQPNASGNAFTQYRPADCFGDPADMAHAAASLCSPKARYITGQSLCIDGGTKRSI